MSAKRNKSKKKNLVQQVVEKLVAIYRPGRSKHADKRRNGGKPLIDVIYSATTLRLYIACCIRFVRAAERELGKLRDIAECWPYVEVYLQKRIEQGLSPDTVHNEASAIAKLYGCRLKDLGVKLPKRGLASNVKNRQFKWTKYFDPRKYPELILVCKAFGVRRCEILRIAPQQVKRRADGSVYLLAVHGKGGKIRDIDAVPTHADEVWELAQRGLREGWTHLVPYKPHANAPIHQIRAIYAWSIYLMYARAMEDVPSKERYRCRESMAGYVFDKRAMWVVTQNLGHARLNVVVNYLAVALAVKDAEVIRNL